MPHGRTPEEIKAWEESRERDELHPERKREPGDMGTLAQRVEERFEFLRNPGTFPIGAPKQHEKEREIVHEVRLLEDQAASFRTLYGALVAPEDEARRLDFRIYVDGRERQAATLVFPDAKAMPRSLLDGLVAGAHSKAAQFWREYSGAMAKATGQEAESSAERYDGRSIEDLLLGSLEVILDQLDGATATTPIGSVFDGRELDNARENVKAVRAAREARS